MGIINVQFTIHVTYLPSKLCCRGEKQRCSVNYSSTKSWRQLISLYTKLVSLECPQQDSANYILSHCAEVIVPFLQLGLLANYFPCCLPTLHNALDESLVKAQCEKGSFLSPHGYSIKNTLPLKVPSTCCLGEFFLVTATSGLLV